MAINPPDSDDRKPLIAAANRDTPAGDACSGSTIAQDHRAAKLADMLVVRHEQWVATAELNRDTMSPLDSCDEDQRLAADFELLDECLRRVEQARREQVVDHSSARSSDSRSINGVDSGMAEDLGERHELMAVTDVGDVPESDPHVQQIGRFAVLRELGRGGLGVVLLAYDPVLRRKVALKIPRPEALLTSELRQRFRHEAHAAARLTHPNIVPVFEVGQAGPIFFIAGEFIDGNNLAHWLKKIGRPLPIMDAAAVIADLADAMHYAHSQGVLHRDLKPGNVLLERKNVLPDYADDAGAGLKAWVPKITDFGLAKVQDLAGNETRTGVVLGTPAYMSPEQARGDRQIGPATDVYALGAMLYEMLSGRLPFRGNSDAETLTQVMTDEVVPFSRLAIEVSRDLEAICLKCLEKRPEQRYESAAGLSADLRRYLAGEPTKARPLSTRQRLLRWAARRPAHAALGVVSLAALLTIFAGVIFYTSQLNEALDLASEHANRAEANRLSANHHEARANEQMYVTQMRLADLAVHQGDLDRANRLLEQYGPDKLGHLRGIEWHVLQYEVARMANSGSESSTTVYPHPDEVYTAQFTPDGRRLATGSQDGHLRIWDPAANQLLYDVRAHDSCVNQLRFSPDGTKLVTASCDSTARLWNIDAECVPELVHTVKHAQPVRFVAFSPDGVQFAALCDCSQSSPNSLVGSIHVWHCESGERVFQSEPPCASYVDGLAWSADGRYLASSWGGLVTVKTTADWRTHYSKQFRPCRIGFHLPSGQLTVFEAGTIRQIDLEQKVETSLLETLHTGDFAWSPTARFLAISDSDGMAHLFDTSNGNRLHSFYQHHDRRVAELAFSPDMSKLATAGFDHKACVTNLSPRLKVVPTAKISSNVTVADNIVASDEACERLTSFYNGRFHRFELANARDAVQEYSPRDGSNTSRAFVKTPLAIPGVENAEWTRTSRNGKRAVWVHSHKAVTIADLERETTYKLPIKFAKGALRAYVFDQRPIVFLIYDFAVRVVDLQTNQELYHERVVPDPTPDLFVDLSPDGHYLVVLNSPLSIRMVDLKSGTSRVVADQKQRTTSPAFSPDGRTFSVVVNDAMVGIWDAETLTLRHLLQPRQRPLVTTFSADSRTIAIGSQREVTFWHVARGQEMVNLTISSDPKFIAFTGDGGKVAWVVNNAGTTELYSWDLSQE